MTKLTSKERSQLSDDQFALPGRKFPIPDPSHARNAITRAAEGLEKGWLTKEQHDTVVRKAKAVLGD